MYGFFYALGKGRAVHGRRTMEEAMQYISTRDKQNRVSASAAIVNGLAEDGGLFNLPRASPKSAKPSSSSCGIRITVTARPMSCRNFWRNLPSMSCTRAHGRPIPVSRAIPRRWSRSTAACTCWSSATAPRWPLRMWR